MKPCELPFSEHTLERHRYGPELTKIHSIPDLPPFEPSTALTIKEACNANLVTSGRARKLNSAQVQRWATRGCRIVKNAPLYAFPSIRSGRERITCKPWCAAWEAWVLRVRLEEARRVTEIVTRYGRLTAPPENPTPPKPPRK